MNRYYTKTIHAPCYTLRNWCLPSGTNHHRFFVENFEPSWGLESFAEFIASEEPGTTHNDDEITELWRESLELLRNDFWVPHPIQDSCSRLLRDLPPRNPLLTKDSDGPSKVKRAHDGDSSMAKRIKEDSAVHIDLAIAKDLAKFFNPTLDVPAGYRLLDLCDAPPEHFTQFLERLRLRDGVRFRQVLHNFKFADTRESLAGLVFEFHSKMCLQNNSDLEYIWGLMDTMRRNWRKDVLLGSKDSLRTLITDLYYPLYQILDIPGLELKSLKKKPIRRDQDMRHGRIFHSTELGIDLVSIEAISRKTQAGDILKLATTMSANLAKFHKSVSLAREQEGNMGFARNLATYGLLFNNLEITFLEARVIYETKIVMVHKVFEGKIPANVYDIDDFVILVSKMMSFKDRVSKTLTSMKLLRDIENNISDSE